MSEFIHSKKFFSLVLLFIILLIVVPVVFVLITHSPLKQATKKQTAQNTQTAAAFTDNTELATFNGAPIYVKDLNALALEQYQAADAKNLNDVSVNNLLNTYVERKILDKQNLGDVSAQITQVEKAMKLTGNQAKYEALREKFTATSPKSWNAYTINFWLPPTKADGSLVQNAGSSNPKQTNSDRKKLVSDVNSALDFAQTELQKGTSVFSVATQITKNYPLLANLLGVNGLIFGNSTNPSYWSSPAVFYYDKNSAGDPFYKTLYAMAENSPATKALNNNNMGGSVIKVVKINNPNGMLDNYQDWLKTQESSFKITNDALKKLGNSR